MNRILLGIAMCLLSLGWAHAQVTAPPDGQNTADSPQSAPERPVHAVEGCLTGIDTGINETFRLTESSGRSYELIGDPVVLANHVGHRVRVSGLRIAWRGESTSTEGLQGTLGVKNLQFLEPTCKMVPTLGDD